MENSRRRRRKIRISQADVAYTARSAVSPTLAADATNTNTYTGRAGQAKISVRHSKKIDGDYDNDNRSASAPLTTSELQENKGRGGGRRSYKRLKGVGHGNPTYGL